MDPRPFHIRLREVAGQIRFITVLPPAPQIHDETVWADRKSNRRIDPENLYYNGLGEIEEA